MIDFIVYGEPKGKGRPKFNTRSGSAYTPTMTRQYEQLVRQSFMLAYRGFTAYGIHTPLKAVIEAYFEIPKSANRIRKSRMIAHMERPTKKPDTDNIAKIILDALNGLAYHDDSQIVELSLAKAYGEIPCVKVKIEEL